MMLPISYRHTARCFISGNYAKTCHFVIEMIGHVKPGFDHGDTGIIIAIDTGALGNRLSKAVKTTLDSKARKL